MQSNTLRFNALCTFAMMQFIVCSSSQQSLWKEGAAGTFSFKSIISTPASALLAVPTWMQWCTLHKCTLSLFLDQWEASNFFWWPIIIESKIESKGQYFSSNLSFQRLPAPFKSNLRQFWCKKAQLFYSFTLWNCSWLVIELQDQKQIDWSINIIRQVNKESHITSSNLIILTTVRVGV